ncbi:uncharacterized protein LOC135846404 [Planococcus citri]|uniref:uncharacterized protein LOC135846404 n=1 Tax=Planococcus citri TaxID=170843 RepID=UPI0031FA1305
MIKSSLLLICTIFVSFQNVYSQMDDFGGLLGSCVEPGISTNGSVYGDIDGKWYTHWVLGKYSPLKFFQCQSNKIDVKTQDPKVISRFAITAIPYSFEWYGNVKPLNTSQGEYTFNYDTVLGYIPQKTAFLRNYSAGAALLWTCLDFQVFHFESILVMTKYQDPTDPHIDDKIYQDMENTLKKSGISPKSFVKIDQYNCN